jgi:hypothetical protein
MGVGTDLRQPAGLINDAGHQTTRVARLFAAGIMHEGHYLAIHP